MYRFNSEGTLELDIQTKNSVHKFALDAVVTILRYPLRLNRFEEAARRLFADTRSDVHYWARMSDAYGQKIVFNETALAHVPRSGPLVVVANHPLNGVEGLA